MTCPSNWIRLNVGGKVFQTSKQTLSREPESFLARLVNDDQTLPIQKDETGSILIDRDPEYFQIILNYLRSGQLIMSEDNVNDQLMEEVEFYGQSALYAVLIDAKREAEKKPTGVVESIQVEHVTAHNGRYYGASGRYFSVVEQRRAR